MKRQSSMFIVAVLLLTMIIFLSACNFSRTGTIPRGTPDTGNGTPAVQPTPAPPTAQPAPANATGDFYAFVRKNQLWVALKGASPVQMTNFDYANAPNAFWQRPVWSPDQRSIAIIMSAQPVGLGGGGCPGPDFGANGSLYVMDVDTKQFTAIMLPAVSKNAPVNGNPRMDYWQYAFWEDAKHLLAWYNGVAGKAGETAGLYRYNVDTQQLTQVIPLKSLGVATLADPQEGMPLLLSLRYSSRQLFYQVVVQPFEQKSQLVLYRHSLAQPEMKSSEILRIGEEPWCASPQSGPFVRPGWDVSPDGEQLVVQKIVAGHPGQGVGAIEALNLKANSTTTLFTQAPAGLLGSDLVLAWGPDSQTVVATEYHPIVQRGPYSASLANPTAAQQYTPHLAGQVVWRADGSAFALESAETVDETITPQVYVFLAGETRGRMLLTDAHQFAWG